MLPLRYENPWQKKHIIKTPVCWWGHGASGLRVGVRGHGRDAKPLEGPEDHLHGEPVGEPADEGGRHGDEEAQGTARRGPGHPQALSLQTRFQGKAVRPGRGFTVTWAHLNNNWQRYDGIVS